MTPLYTNRYNYIQQLRSEEPSRLNIFKDASSVEDLVKKQYYAHNMAMTSRPGWQGAMQQAGIWDDDGL